MSNLKHYINGKMHEGEEEGIVVTHPALEEPAGTYRHVSDSQILHALQAAEAAFPEWSGLSLSQREEWIHRLIAAIRCEQEHLLDLLMSETGKPLDNAEYDLDMLVQSLQFFCEEGKRLEDSIIPDANNSFRHHIVRRPLGVVAGYLAWNFPLLNLGYKLGPTLASGCTCVLKPSERTPLATLYIGEIASRIGFPPGVFNLVAGYGPRVGSIMNSSSITKMITLIGSSRAGREVINQSSHSIKRFSLELGGNAPVIITPDADLEQAAKQVADLKFTNAGQVCVSPNRVFVQEKVQESFVQEVRKHAESIKLGWGREEGALMGPLISFEARERMQSLVDDAIGKGAVLVCGGNKPQNKPKGFYYSPTVLRDVAPHMDIYQQEIFGPLLSIIPYRDLHEAVTMANATEYGLAAYVFSQNLGEAHEIAEKLEFGTVCVNEPIYAIHLPHGGIKNSGVGKDCSRYSLEEYYYLKRISIKK